VSARRGHETDEAKHDYDQNATDEPVFPLLKLKAEQKEKAQTRTNHKTNYRLL